MGCMGLEPLWLRWEVCRLGLFLLSLAKILLLPEVLDKVQSKHCFFLFQPLRLYLRDHMIIHYLQP